MAVFVGNVCNLFDLSTTLLMLLIFFVGDSFVYCDCYFA